MQISCTHTHTPCLRSYHAYLLYQALHIHLCNHAFYVLVIYTNTAYASLRMQCLIVIFFFLSCHLLSAWYVPGTVIGVVGRERPSPGSKKPPITKAYLAIQDDKCYERRRCRGLRRYSWEDRTLCQADKVIFKLKQAMHNLCPKGQMLFRLGGRDGNGKFIWG